MIRAWISLILIILLASLLLWGQGVGTVGFATGVVSYNAVSSFTLVSDSPATLGCSGSTTCAVTINGTWSAGNLAIVQCGAVNPVSVASVDVGGTLIPIHSASGMGTSSGFTLWWSTGYIYPTTTIPGSTVTVTFTGNMGSGGDHTTCRLQQWSLSPNQTPKLDFAHSTIKAGTTSVTGETSTLSGTKDLIVQTNSTDYQLTTAVTGYTNGVFEPEGPGWANLLNTSSGTAPTWTIASGSGNAATTVAALGTDATACNDDLFMRFEGSTSGTTVTGTLLNNNALGMPITGSSSAQSYGWSTNIGTLSSMTFQSATPPALHTSVRPCGDGTVRTGSTTFTTQYDYSSTTQGFALYGIPGGGLTSSFGMLVNTNFPAADTNFHDAAGIGSAGNSFVNLQVGGDGTNTALRLECFGTGTTGFSSNINITPSTYFWATVKNDSATGGSLNVYETTGWTQVGSTVTCPTGGWTAHIADTFALGQVGSTADFPTAVIKYANARMNPGGVFPVGP